MSSDAVNLWDRPDHARRFLEQRTSYPWRATAYGELLAWVPPSPRRVLDLGCGDGEVTARIREAWPLANVVAADFSDEMLRRAGARFAADPYVEVVRHDLDEPLPAAWGSFEAVVSAFAIHHVVDERKRALYAEVFERLEPGGSFVNLEHVASATPELHDAWLACLGHTAADDDPSNKLAPVDEQLSWLRAVGFEQVDCHYKWREIALLSGVRR